MDTSWFLSTKALIQNLHEVLSTPEASLPFLPLLDVRPGSVCLVRGPPSLQTYNKWIKATVRSITRGCRLGNVTTDRIEVDLVDPDGRVVKGSFFTRWGEVVAIGGEHSMPSPTMPIVADMIRTRLVFTPVISRTKRCRTPGYWCGPTWFPAFREAERVENGVHQYGVRFLHIFGGRCAPEVTWVRTIQPAENWNRLRDMAFGVGDRSTVELVGLFQFAIASKQDFEEMWHRWGSGLWDKNTPRFRCKCTTGKNRTEYCHQV